MNYIYIDDDAIDKSKDKISGFISTELTIETQQHRGSWEEQIKYISEISNNIDGLILDLELNDLPNEKNERAYFRGTSLAQEIRTRQKGNDIKSFPIVLFSAQDKLDTLLESTGFDLFDICINKDVSSDVFEQYSLQLYALAYGYKILIEEEQIANILGIDIELIDSRFISELHRNMKLPIHVRAMFILRELINRQGLLIDEEVLAARMGIDKNLSEDWSTLSERISNTKYIGVFSEGWQRWWMPLVEKWFESITTENWRSLSARNRVEIIKQTTGLSGLNFAERINKSTSDEFWTVCQGYHAPIDTIDALILDGQENLYPWQEPLCVSIDAALKRKNKLYWGDIAEVEKEYFEKLIKMYKKEK
ncbi:hypothetical protein [Gabonibacter chumensis]|uniref:hypothetical protein n=1 Tax=Gabonibacter chumensis TaxID=2972474 RepID=UPI002574266B|nr:hypothetical protein [Gabonibacter chumensis]MCR9012139.1 hypothetical protein [Gabonibacter chumensis]